MDANGKVALINFVKLNRIQGKAKTRLGELSGVDSFQKLKDTLTIHCGARETTDSLYDKLSLSKQGRRSLTQFVEDLDSICERIVALEVANQKVTDDAIKLAIKNTVKAQAL